MAGIAHWEQHTCIKFQQTTNTNQPHLIFIRGSGCWSYIGKLNQNGQLISIGNGCTLLAIVAHEIAHSLGLYHEQSRQDRDDYVFINFDNIITGRENNFMKGTWINNRNITYDYYSAMHYGPKGFTNNGKSTIFTLDPMMHAIIGQRIGLSHRDIHLTNLMYNCIDKWLENCNMSTDPCQKDGYTGSDCNCVCPPGTSGSMCETQTGGYYDKVMSNCSETITEEGNITSPNYPSNYPKGNCVKVIEAPECQEPTITFSDFQLYPKVAGCNGQMCCYFDSLEMRLDSSYDSTVFCGTEITAGQSFTATGGRMILYFLARSNNIMKGFSAEVTFEYVPGCSTNTSTSTSTSTTSTSTTTTTPPPPKCKIQYYSGSFYWSSPNFGVQNYPDNFRCGVAGSSSRSMLTVTLMSFDLEPKQNICNDNVTFTFLYGKTKTWCGSKGMKIIKSPSFNFRALFTSNSVINDMGFNISLRPTTTECHKIITTTAVGEKGKIVIPKGKMYHYCEYRIKAPSGSQVRVKKIVTNMRNSLGCKKDYALLNGSSNRLYPQNESQIFCGKQKVKNPMVSTKGEIYLAYKGSKKSKGLTMKYKII